MNISKTEYQEYLAWKQKKEIETSLQETYNLEDDIDFPIRNSVAILALAGCSTMFSCCGFDYHGQPSHKAHQYGEPYIMMRSDHNTETVLATIQTRLAFGWRIRKQQGLLFLELIQINSPHWDDSKVIHYSENMVIALNNLEKSLFQNLKDILQEEVIMEDTNKEHNRNLKYWQYPPKNPWVITLESLTV